MSTSILICSPIDSAFTMPLFRAFSRIGFKARIFDYKRGSIYTRTMGLITNVLKLKNETTTLKIHKLIQYQLVKTARSFHPDIILVVKGESIPTSTIDRLNELGSTTVNWYPDWLVLWDQVKIHAPHYKYFFTMCADLTREVKKINPNTAFILPAAEPDQILHNQRDLPLTFIGQYSRRREKYLTEIKDLGLRIWGYKQWRESKLREISTPEVSHKESMVLLRRTKITVNLLTGDDQFQPYAINTRTFEAIATGALLLVQDHPLLHKHFSVGKELITFDSPQDLREKAKYYLSHSIESGTIAKAGWLRIIKEHTFRHRVNTMLKYINKYIYTGSPFSLML